MSKNEFLLPSAAELYALEQAARRNRARMQARLAVAAAHWVKETAKGLFAVKAHAGKAVFHG